MMKSYRNEQYGFEIEIPDAWSFHTEYDEKGSMQKVCTLIFQCQPDEAFSIQVLKKDKTRLAEVEYQQLAQEKGYTNLVLGKLVVENQEQVWARYYVGYGQWTKKYSLVFKDAEYLLTSNCCDEKKLFEMEQVWDRVVASFRQCGALLPERQFQSRSVSAKPSPQKKTSFELPPIGYKTYRNEKHSFEIELPEDWQPAPALAEAFMNAVAPIPPWLKKEVFQYSGEHEAINFEIGPLFPEPLLEDTEVEFSLYARNQGFTVPIFGRIRVAGKEHICAHYSINDNLGKRWNKKYMLVLGGIEYALTMTCDDPGWFAKREKDWDVIIQTFRVVKPVDESANTTSQAERDLDQQRNLTRQQIALPETLGDLYAKGYEVGTVGNYAETLKFLEECLRENPDHLLAHKELAVVLERLGDIKGAIRHRQEARRLDRSDLVNNAKLEKLLAENGGQKKQVEQAASGRVVGRQVHAVENLRQTTGKLREISAKTQPKQTFAFASRSYLLIMFAAYFYIEKTIGIHSLAFLTSENHAPLSGFQFFVLCAVLYFGLGAFICEIFVIGMGFSETGSNFILPVFDYARRTMLRSSEGVRTVGAQIFSDYTRWATGLWDGLILQAQTVFHALLKILFVPLNIGQGNPILGLMLIFMPFVAEAALKRQLPLTWAAVYIIVLFSFCYRAFLFTTARQSKVEATAGPIENRLVASPYSLDAHIQSAATEGVSPDLILKLLEDESICNTIKNDLSKSRQIGYREVWKLGLLTPELDYYPPEPGSGSRAEALKQISQNLNYRLRMSECLPLKRTAVIHNRGMFNIQTDSLATYGGVIKPVINPYPGYATFHLATKIGPGEFLPLRNIQIEVDRRSEIDDSTIIYKQKALVDFLRDDGFPLKAAYSDGDPLTTERGGTLVIDRGKLLFIYPSYFIQRRLIDDEGSLVEIGLDESFGNNIAPEVKMRPSVSEGLFRAVQSNHYIPVVRYRSVPYASEYMLPILDTPMSASGWADLYIDPTGKGKLFISRQKTEVEWYEMLAKLRELFFKELGRKNYHLLGLAKNPQHLNDYLRQKQEILKEYFIIQDWRLT